MGHSTEHLVSRVGEGTGGFLNATFGNAAELIIAIAALRQGQIEVVRSSIIGSILGNILLIFGLSMLVGGARRQRVGHWLLLPAMSSDELSKLLTRTLSR